MSVTATQAIAAYRANHGIGPETVDDTATALLANLGSLETLNNNGKLSSVTLTGSATVSAAQAGALASLNNFTLSGSLAIDDNAGHLLTLASISSLAAATFELLGAYNNVTAAQATTLAGLNGFSLGGGAALQVSDSAANLLSGANAAGLAVATKVEVVGTSNSVSAGQAETLAAYPGFLVAFNATFVVSDSATNLLANAAGVAKATSVVLTGSATVTAAQAATLAAMHNFSLGQGATLTVSDSATNLLAAANRAGLAKATSVSLTGTNTVTAQQAAQLAATNSFGLAVGATMTISDTAAAILATRFAAGRPYGTAFTVTGANRISVAQATTLVGLPDVTMGGGATLTVADVESNFTGSSGVLAELPAGYSIVIRSVAAADVATWQANPNVTQIFVDDTAANVGAHLDALNASSDVQDIWISDGAAVPITYTQYTTDTTAISLFQNDSLVTVSEVPAADAASVQAASSVSGFSVTDTAANISSAFDTLNGLSKLTAINASDGNAFTITYTQYNNDTTTIGFINSSAEASNGYAVSEVPVADLATVQAGTNVVSVSVSDSSANIAAAFDDLNTDTKLTGIVPTDNTPLAITYWQLENDTNAQSLLPDNYELTVSGVPTADASAVQADSHVVSFSVTDSPGDISGSLDSLNTDSNLSSIVMQLPITYTQFSGDSSVLALLSDSFSLAVSGAPVSAAGMLQSDSQVSAFSVSDTVANVAGASGTLDADNKLTSLTVHGTSGGDTLDVTAFTMPTTIDLCGNGASSTNLTTGSPTFSGAIDAVTLGSHPATVDYKMSASGGIETVLDFQYMQDALNIDLSGAGNGALTASDILVNGQHSISLTNTSDTGHGIILVNVPSIDTAADLLANHTTFANGHAMIT